MTAITVFVETLAGKAVDYGVSDARTVPASSILIEERFAAMCETPRCPGYGRSANCPPHSMKPAEFRELLKHYEYALVFKIDVPTAVLLTDDRHAVARLVHETASRLERLAVESGYPDSRALAAGSCRRLFCSDYDHCPALEADGACRFPDSARPSVSGAGINFFDLSKAIGWHIDRITSESDPENTPMGMLAGIVLVG
ncbi:MAG: DUF2284 domain-containing protein [Dehalococcoidia bacterium]|nr:DUF2284 domain-containing protein [Dehalococcoidia bacterium]